MNHCHNSVFEFEIPGFRQQFPVWSLKRTWGVFGEDVGSKADLLLPAKSAFPPSLAVRCCRQAPKEGFTALLDRHTQALSTAKMLKLRIAVMKRVIVRVVHLIGLSGKWSEAFIHYQCLRKWFVRVSYEEGLSSLKSGGARFSVK